MFLENSLDVLYIVLALCILWFTVFLCWLLYQAARVLRNANAIIENLMEKLELISDAVQFIKGKVEGLTHSMGAVSGMMGTLAERFMVGKLEKALGDRLEKKSVSKRKAKK